MLQDVTAFGEEKGGCNGNLLNSVVFHAYVNLFLDFVSASTEEMRSDRLRELITNRDERIITMCKRYCVSKAVVSNVPEHVNTHWGEKVFGMENH